MPEKKKESYLEILRELIQIMKDEDLSEICVEQNGIKVKVKRASEHPSFLTQGAAMLTTHEERAHLSEAKRSAEELVIIRAPMVGTFYRASSPDAEPYVNVGDEIKVGQVICVIEAMKLMNEIPTELDGEIVEILAEDGQPIEYDQPMFQVRPK